MKYSINRFVDFDNCRGILSLINDNHTSVQLSRPGGRLLNELITHSGMTLTREALLKNVWEDHGLIPSNNNLSNHISFLRKIFAQLGVEENIIVTSPREGFRLQAEIEIVSDEDCAQQDNVGEEEMSPQHPAMSRETEIKQRQRKIRRLFRRKIINMNFLVIPIIIFSLIMTYAHFSGFIFQHEKNSTAFVGYCEVIDLESGKDIDDREKMSIVKKIIEEKNINCINKRSHLYLKATQLTMDNEHKQQAIFLAQCFLIDAEMRPECGSYLTLTQKKP